MDVWIFEQKDGWVRDGRMDSGIERWVEGWVERSKDGWMGRWIFGYLDRRMDR